MRAELDAHLPLRDPGHERGRFVVGVELLPLGALVGIRSGQRHAGVLPPLGNRMPAVEARLARHAFLIEHLAQRSRGGVCRPARVRVQEDGWAVAGDGHASAELGGDRAGFAGQVLLIPQLVSLNLAGIATGHRLHQALIRRRVGGHQSTGWTAIELGRVLHADQHVQPGCDIRIDDGVELAPVVLAGRLLD